MFDEIFQQGVEEEEEEEEERTDNTYIRPSSPPGSEEAVRRLEVPGAGPGPQQSLVMQTLLTNYRPIQQGWLAKKVLIMSHNVTQCHTMSQTVSRCFNVNVTMSHCDDNGMFRCWGRARSHSMTGGLSPGSGF